MNPETLLEALQRCPPDARLALGFATERRLVRRNRFPEGIFGPKRPSGAVFPEPDQFATPGETQVIHRPSTAAPLPGRVAPCPELSLDRAELPAVACDHGPGSNGLHVECRSGGTPSPCRGVPASPSGINAALPGDPGELPDFRPPARGRGATGTSIDISAGLSYTCARKRAGRFPASFGESSRSS